MSAGPLVLLPALAAAVVARMESLPIAFVAGVGLGIMEQVVGWNTSGSPTLQNALFLSAATRAPQGESLDLTGLGAVRYTPLPSWEVVQR